MKKRQEHPETMPSVPSQTHLDEIVDEASRESFPASDPPAWTGGHEEKEDSEAEGAD